MFSYIFCVFKCDNNILFLQNVKFHTQMPRRATKEDSIVIAELQVGPIEPGKSANWNQKMTIPPLPPSNLVNCGIIDLDYDLKVLLKNFTLNIFFL